MKPEKTADEFTRELLEKVDAEGIAFVVVRPARDNNENDIRMDIVGADKVIDYANREKWTLTEDNQWIKQ